MRDVLVHSTNDTKKKQKNKKTKTAIEGYPSEVCHSSLARLPIRTPRCISSRDSLNDLSPGITKVSHLHILL